MKNKKKRNKKKHTTTKSNKFIESAIKFVSIKLVEWSINRAFDYLSNKLHVLDLVISVMKELL
ncbi:hypothetical protein D3C75_1342890 [compost metagenome]